MLSAICRSIELLAPKDSTDLHHVLLVPLARCKKQPNTGETVNQIKGYAKKDTASVVTQAATLAYVLTGRARGARGHICFADGKVSVPRKRQVERPNINTHPLRREASTVAAAKRIAKREGQAI